MTDPQRDQVRRDAEPFAAFKEWALRPYGKPQSEWSISRHDAAEVFLALEQAERLADHNAAELALCGGKLYDCQVQLEQAKRERDEARNRALGLWRAMSPEQQDALIAEGWHP